jgi:hypothetical protein
LQRPADEGSDLGGDTATEEKPDFGDEPGATKDVAPAPDTELTEEEQEFLPKDGDEKPRGADGKFAKKEDKDGPMIPKARFDEQVAREREGREYAERKLQEVMQNQQQVQRSASVQELEQRASELRTAERKAIFAGDDEKAEQFAAQRDYVNRQIAISESQNMSVQAKDQAVESIRMEMTINNLKEAFPALDEDNEAFDQDLVDDVLDKQRGYIERGRMAPAAALAKAAKYVIGRYAPAAEEKTGLDAAATSTSKDRKAAAVAKNIAASKAQPASTRDVGLDTDKAGMKGSNMPNVANLSPDEYDALPEATKAKLRGDFL